MVAMRSRIRDETRHHVQERRLAGARAAADDRVQPRLHARGEEVEHRPRERPVADQVVGFQALLGKTANREQRAVDGQRRNDRVDARAVGKPRVHHRRAVVDTATDGAHDPIDDPHQVAIVLERAGHALQHTGSFHVHLLVGVHEDVVDGRVAQQRFERPEPEDLVEDVAEDLLALRHRERLALLAEQLEEQRADVAFGARPIDGRKGLEVQPVQQLPVNVRLQLDVLRPRRLRARSRARWTTGRRRGWFRPWRSSGRRWDDRSR